jgi:hypothetical protein
MIAVVGLKEDARGEGMRSNCQRVLPFLFWHIIACCESGEVDSWKGISTAFMVMIGEVID